MDQSVVPAAVPYKPKYTLNVGAQKIDGSFRCNATLKDLFAISPRSVYNLVYN